MAKTTKTIKKKAVKKVAKKTIKPVVEDVCVCCDPECCQEVPVKKSFLQKLRDWFNL